jgi:hypothetical protein
MKTLAFGEGTLKKSITALTCPWKIALSGTFQATRLTGGY